MVFTPFRNFRFSFFTNSFSIHTKRLFGEKNGMYGKTVSEETKAKISKGCKNHPVSEMCKLKSSNRWSGINNPACKQEYWDRKDFEKNNRQISCYEKMIADFLDVQEVEYVFQKVFTDGSRAYVADFFIPEKNLVVECESKFKTTQYNQFEKSDKFQFYKQLGLNLLITNPNYDSIWMKHLNKCEKIVEINYIQQKQTVYDIEIQDVSGKSQVHDFYANDILTHNCCRLRLDNRELRKRGGGLFASNPMTGSIGVVTINLPKLAYETKEKTAFFDSVYNSLLIARKSLSIKRKLLERYTENGLYPYARFYLSKIKNSKRNQYWSNHFNTIGVIGMNEACLNLLNQTIATTEGKQFAIETLEFIREKLTEFQEQDDMMYNLEATPGEGTSYRLAQMDKRQYPDIKTSGITEPYYTNSTQLPVNQTTDIFDALQHQDEIQCLYTGGTVIHGFIGEQIHDPEVCKELVKKIANTFKLPYFTVTPTFSICPVHGYIAGEHHNCPVITKMRQQEVVS